MVATGVRCFAKSQTPARVPPFLESSTPRRSPLSGRFPDNRNPRLKPWAVLYSRFAAKSDRPYGTNRFGHNPRQSRAGGCLDLGELSRVATIISPRRDNKPLWHFFVLANAPANRRYSLPPPAAAVRTKQDECTASDHAWTPLDWIRARSPDHNGRCRRS